MLQSRVGVLCLAAAACSFASVAREATAAATQAVYDGFLSATSAELEPKKEASDILAPDATIPLPSHENANVEEKPNTQINSSEVQAEKLAAKVFAFVDAYSTIKRKGTRTALIGLAGLTLFLALHALTQYVRYQPMNRDVLFNRKTGKVTFTGAGMIMSFAFFAAGVAEAISAARTMKKGNIVSSSPFPRRGAKRAIVGGQLATMSAVGIALGWILGAPAFLMMMQTTLFLIGITLRALGVTSLYFDLVEAFDLMDEINAFGSDDSSAMGEYAEMDPALLRQLMDHSLGSEKSVEDFLGTQAGSEKKNKQLKTNAKQAAALLNADTLAAVAQQLQKLQQASQLPEQLETSPEGSAAPSEVTDPVGPLTTAGEEEVPSKD